MTDIGSIHFVKGGAQVLVPQPSSDPHDPLVSTLLRFPLPSRQFSDVAAELEQEMEVRHNVHGYSRLLYSRLRATCFGTHVSCPH